jgi:hypothetical protein
MSARAAKIQEMARGSELAPAAPQDHQQAREHDQSDQPAQGGHNGVFTKDRLLYCSFGFRTSTSSCTEAALFASMAFSASFSFSW